MAGHRRTSIGSMRSSTTPVTRASRVLVAHSLTWLLAVLGSAAMADGLVDIRVNAGGGAFTDSNGKAWIADTAYNTGQATAAADSVAIARTDDDALYRSNRFDFDGGDELLYSFQVPSGFYEVKLHFAETWPGAFTEGARVFDVEIENSRVIEALDVYAFVGANTAYVRSVIAEVRDGVLDIRFLHRVQNPNVSAIEIRTLRYRLTEVGTLGDRDITVGRDMNDLGWVTGRFDVSGGYPFSVPFVAKGGAPVALNGSLTYQSSGIAINNSGVVAISGIPDNDGNGRQRAFVWNGNTYSSFGGNEIRGLNERGWMASWGGQQDNAWAYLWDGIDQRQLTYCGFCSTVMAVGGINSAGLIAATDGGQPPAPARGAFVWSPDAPPRFLPMLGGTRSEAQRINDRDVVVGKATDASGAWRLVRWDSAGIRDLGDWPAGGFAVEGTVTDMNYAGAFIVGTQQDFVQTRDTVLWDGARRSVITSLGGGGKVFAKDISETNLVVGSALDPSGQRRALLTSGGTSHDLNSFLDPADRQRVTLTEAVKINARGQILANGTVASGGTRPYILELVEAGPADSTPPEIEAAVSGTQGSNGWYRSNVTLSWTVRDPHSAIANSNGCGTVVVSADTAGNTYSCAASSAGGNGSKSVTIRRDSTPPAVSSTRLPLANPSGWSNAPVTVSFFATDALAGVGAGACTTSVLVSTEGANQSVPGSCTDLAGNSQSSLVTGISIDLTPPIASATAGLSPNAAGWYRTPVTVTFAGADSMTGSGIAACSEAVVLSTDGRDQGASGTCSDRAGNSSLAARTVVNVDRTAPTIQVTAPASGASYQQGATVAAAFSCADALSGMASCTGTVAPGSAVATDGVGKRTFTVTATDAAGNTTTSSVEYTVTASAPAPAPTPTPAPGTASSAGSGGGGALGPRTVALLAGLALLGWRGRRIARVA